MPRWLFICLAVVLLAGCAKPRDPAEHQAFQYLLIGLRYESGTFKPYLGDRERLDSAMTFYMAAFNLPFRRQGNDSQVKAADLLAQGYYTKSQNSRSSDQADRYLKEAMIMLAWMKRLAPEDGRTFVLEQKIVYGDPNWYFNETEKQLYRLTPD